MTLIGPLQAFVTPSFGALNRLYLDFDQTLRYIDVLVSRRPAGTLFEIIGVSVAVSQELLEILACPVCIKSVRLTPDQKGLKCEQCHRVYPIVDDIPVMLIEEATIQQEPETNQTSK